MSDERATPLDLSTPQSPRMLLVATADTANDSASNATVVEVCPLVELCKAGDASAWRALYQQHFDFAWRMARRLGTPEADVEDVVQDSFEAAHRHLHQFRGGRFTTWLYQIIAHRVSNRLRARRVRELFASLLPKEPELAASSEGEVEARRTLAVVERLLRKLPREKREVLALSEVSGLSHAEIAELTGAPVATVRTRIFYARKMLVELCAKEGVEL